MGQVSWEDDGQTVWGNEGRDGLIFEQRAAGSSVCVAGGESGEQPIT